MLPLTIGLTTAVVIKVRRRVVLFLSTSVGSCAAVHSLVHAGTSSKGSTWPTDTLSRAAAGALDIVARFICLLKSASVFE